jgi:sialidase-1
MAGCYALSCVFDGAGAAGAAARTAPWRMWNAGEAPLFLGTGMALRCPRPIAYGDFRVELETRISAAARLELRAGADAYTIDAASGRLTCTASEGIRTYLQKPLDVELPGVSTNGLTVLAVTRTTNHLVVTWNGLPVYEAPYARDTVGHAQVQVQAGGAEVRAFRVEGLLPAVPEAVPVFVSGTEGSARYRIPSLIRTPGGTLVAFAEARREGTADQGNIDLVLRRSTDGGKSWGAVELLYDEGGDRRVTCGNLSPVMDRQTGRLWVFFLVCERWNVGEFKLMRMFSDDEGRSWSEPADIRTTVGNPEWRSAHPGPGHGIQLTRGPLAGRLLVSGWYYMGGVNGVFVLYSDDHGESWQRHEPVAEGPNETMLAELDDGGVMAMMRPRHRSASPWRLAATSPDGIRWSEPWRLGGFRSVVCQASVLRPTWPAADAGRLYFCHPGAGNYSHPDVHRAGLTLRTSFDGGHTWPVRELIYPGRSAYSDLTDFPDGSVGCLFENGDLDMYERISFARWTPLCAGSAGGAGPAP